MHNFDVNDLNTFYASVHSSSLGEIPEQESVASIFNFKLITCEEIIEAVQRVSSNAIGHDGVPIKFLKITLQYFMNAIIHMFNFSLETCTFPDAWNEIIIKPIGKVTEPKEISQTRPISNNSVMTKLFTSVCNNQIKEYIEGNNI